MGLGGMLLGRRRLATAASLSLLTFLVVGKIAANTLRTSPPDSAILLVEFTAVLVFMEASFAVFTLDKDYASLKGRGDEISQVLGIRLRAWLRNLLVMEGKLALGALVLSIGLLPLAGFTSIPSNHIAFSATLALLAIVVLMFLITHRRELETG